MYVCICKAVTDKDIQRAVGEGAMGFQCIREQFEAGKCCGRCKPEITQIVDEEVRKLASQLGSAA